MISQGAASPRAPGVASVWRAIDAEAERQVDREATRKLRWHQALMRWLVEYNKY